MGYFWGQAVNKLYSNTTTISRPGSSGIVKPTRTEEQRKSERVCGYCGITRANHHHPLAKHWNWAPLPNGCSGWLEYIFAFTPLHGYILFPSATVPSVIRVEFTVNGEHDVCSFSKEQQHQHEPFIHPPVLHWDDWDSFHDESCLKIYWIKVLSK